MLKCILFLLSGYYFEVVREREAEIRANFDNQILSPDVLACRMEEGGQQTADEKGKTLILAGGQEWLEWPRAGKRLIREETLLITDLPGAARDCLESGWYVAVLYHEQNRGEEFPPVRYGIEDVFALEGRSYEEVYRRLAGLPWDILETERLLVRESIIPDVEAFYRIYQEPSITRYMEDLFPEKEAEQTYMKAYIDQIYGFYGYGLWSVVQKESGQVIGRAGLSVREGYDLAELGFVIEKSCQQKGYASEVCAAILQYAREELNFERVQALVREENRISKHLLLKLGFLYEKKVQEKDGEYELYTVSL